MPQWLTNRCRALVESVRLQIGMPPSFRYGGWLHRRSNSKTRKGRSSSPRRWTRSILSEIYLQIIAGNEKPPLLTLLNNLCILDGPSRIGELTTRVLENPHFDPSGFLAARVQMILGLL
jgi:hypothetical protein